MHDQPDIARLERALLDAITALPLAGCPAGDAALLREYREVVLMLLHARQRAQRLGELLATAAGP